MMADTFFVSTIIISLQSELGCQLFDRAANKISLNEKGARFFESVEAVFEELNKGIAEVTSKKETQEKSACSYVP